MNVQAIKAILFDLDGTLLDTVKDIGTGVNEALRRYALPEHPIDAYRAYVGHGIRELIRQAVPEGIADETYEAVLQFYLQYYPEHCTVHTDCYPGIYDLLARLQKAGYQMAVISNKTEKTACRIVDHYFTDVPFRFVWGNNGSRPLKPALDAAGLACEELSLTPEQVLYFGDGDTDMEFGSKSGFLTVGCSWGYRSVAQLWAAGAHEIVYHPEELLNLLKLA